MEETIISELKGSARESLFPKLSASQISRLATVGRRRRATEGEVIFDPGTTGRSMFVVLQGRLEAITSSAQGEVRIATVEPSEFTGEVNMLAGRPTLVRLQAAAASELLEIEPATLRQIPVSSSRPRSQLYGLPLEPDDSSTTVPTGSIRRIASSRGTSTRWNGPKPTAPGCCERCTRF